MAHGMTETDKGAFKGAVWHQNHTNSEILEEAMTAHDARQRAFPWEPILVKTYARVGGQDFIEVPGTFQVVRNDLATDDPNRFISTGRGVGRKFKMIDNSSVADMMDALTNSGAHVVSAFSLFGGQRVVMVAQLGEDRAVNDDAMRLYLVMTTAHDGTAALRLLVSPTRVVCWNTLSFAMRDFQQSVSIQHRRNAVERLAEAEQLIATCAKSFGSQVDVLRKLSDVKLVGDRAEKLIETIFPGESKQSENTRDKVRALYNGGQIGADLNSVRETAFGMVSAVTQYVEEDMTLRAHKDALDKVRDPFDLRAQSVLFGAGARLRQRAVDAAIALTN